MITLKELKPVRNLTDTSLMLPPENVWLRRYTDEAALGFPSLATDFHRL